MEEPLDRITPGHVALVSTPVISAARNLSSSSAMFSRRVDNANASEILYKDKAPHEYYSPITFELMEDPVIIIKTEQVCDRKDVEAWFATGKRTCPIINEPLSDNGPHYIRNHSLRNLIEDWKKANKVNVNVPVSESPK